jgi:hypothetical protein
VKKALFAVLTVCLAALAIFPAACDKGTEPGAFSSYSLQGVTFSYPAEWINQTAEMEQSLAEDDPTYSDYMAVAAWGTPSDSAGLFAMSLDVQALGMPKNYTMTEADKESIAESMNDAMTEAMDNPTIVSQGQITVSGQWAWQTEFSGTIEGVDAKGYSLTVISDDTVFILLFAAKSSVWNSLKSTYDTVKASIVM